VIIRVIWSTLKTATTHLIVTIEFCKPVRIIASKGYPDTFSAEGKNRWKAAKCAVRSLEFKLNLCDMFVCFGEGKPRVLK